MLTMLTSNADFVWDSLRNFAGSTGIAGFFSEMGWGSVAMICVAFFLLYLAIRHKFEPLLLFTIAFGMLLTNLPGANLYHTELFADGHVHWDIFVANAGLLDYLYLGVKLGIYPCLIFVGVGAMTDFGPLIANPKSFLLGAAAQIGIFATFLGARAGDPAAHHARADQQEGAWYQNAYAAPGVETGAHPLSADHRRDYLAAAAECGAADRLPHAG